jgi:hypothetical protein
VVRIDCRIERWMEDLSFCFGEPWRLGSCERRLACVQWEEGRLRVEGEVYSFLNMSGLRGARRRSCD